MNWYHSLYCLCRLDVGRVGVVVYYVHSGGQYVWTCTRAFVAYSPKYNVKDGRLSWNEVLHSVECSTSFLKKIL